MRCRNTHFRWPAPLVAALLMIVVVVVTAALFYGGGDCASSSGSNGNTDPDSLATMLSKPKIRERTSRYLGALARKENTEVSLYHFARHLLDD